MISIKNFVSSDIQTISQPTPFSGFRTTVYFASAVISNPTVVGGNFIVLHSALDIVGTATVSAAVTQSIQEYFRNGGTSLCLVSPSEYTLEGFKADMYAVASVVQDYFFVAIGNAISATPSGYSAVELGKIVDFGSGKGWSQLDEKALNQIRICLTTNSASFITANSLLQTLAVVKYSTLVNTGDLVDAALLVGAYFSKVDTSVLGSIKDYNFTPESIGNGWFEDISQATFVLLNNNPTNGNYNVIGKVANRVLNIGGDYCSPDNISISLDFGTSCIERDLDFAMITALFGKVSLTQGGQSKLIDGIKSQLSKYVDNGFLETDATYTGDTVELRYNEIPYTVIRKGDILPLGYRVFYVPINAISAADKSKKRFPNIFVAFQSVHGARVIKVNGSIL